MTLKPPLFIVMLMLVSEAFSIELSLGIAELPPCPTARWASGNVSVPTRGQSLQTIRVKAIAEGENLENPIVLAQVRECATLASRRINLQFLATEPSEGNALFKNIFGQCVEAKKPPIRIHFVSLKLEGYCERLSVVVPATRFARAERVAVASGQVARYGEDVVLNAPPYESGPNAVEYEVVAPAEGIYRFDAEYASAESRPLTITLNGTVITKSGLSVPTGCWEPTCQQWKDQGKVRLNEGRNLMRLETKGVFPHLRTIRFTPTE